MKIGEYTRRIKCSLCQSEKLDHAFSLPPTPLANEFVKTPDVEQEYFPLDILLCRDCGHLQLGTLVSPERLFRDYVYKTGTSESTRRRLAQLAEDLVTDCVLDDRSLVVEIGSNDGTLLKFFKEKEINVVGVDPSGIEAPVKTVREMFSKRVAIEIKEKHGPADLVIADNVFAHCPDVAEMLTAVGHLIDHRGSLTMEVSYIGDLLDDLAFDTIYHEHMSYHAARPLYRALVRHGLVPQDDLSFLDRSQVGRGSMRIIANAVTSRQTIEKPGQHMIADEEERRFFDLATYAMYRDRVTNYARYFHELLRDEVRDGNMVAGFGAPAKVTTFMHVTQLSKRECAYLCEDAVEKQGLFTPGLHIPVVAPQFLLNKKTKPDTCVVYAWNFARDIITRYADLNIKWIVPLPKLLIGDARSVLDRLENVAPARILKT